MNDQNQVLKNAVIDFTVSSDNNTYHFPAGGSVEILTQQEFSLFEALGGKGLSESQKIRQLSEGLDWSDCYSLVIFGVRLAIQSVRINETIYFKRGLLALVAGSSKIDWRDVLRACSIFENCACRLEIDFESEINSLNNSSDFNISDSINSYFSRDNEMKSIEVMGIVEVVNDGKLSFKSVGGI